MQGVLQMTTTRFTPWVALACIGTLAACTTSGEGGAAGNTELNVIVPTNAGTPSAIDIQSVEYTITCLGNDDTFLDNNDSFADQVRIDGNLEVVDGRTSDSAGTACVGGDNDGATCSPNRCTGGDSPGAACSADAQCQGTSPVADGTCDPSPNSTECGGTSPVADGSCETVADFGASPGNQPLPNNQSEIWQGYEDLPPGPCNMQIRARDNDGEVICTTDEGFFVTADVTVKVNLILYCQTSFQAPVGSADFDATFSFNVGNFCPDLFILNCVDTDPVPAELLPPPNPLIAATTCEVRFRDGDSTCGNNCDPQDCNPSATGLSCTPGPNPGVSTTITCTDSGGGNSALLDCTGDGAPDASCTIAGDTFGLLPEFLEGVAPGTPIPCATDAFCQGVLGNLPDAVCVGGLCDFAATNPRLNASFVVACAPPGPPFFGTPGATITCTAVTTDGDIDCDKTKTVTVSCPGLDACNPAATPTPPDCVALSSECVNDVCENQGGTATCVFDSNVPSGGGINCTTCPGAPASLCSCNGAGSCDDFGCTIDDDCDIDGNECTVAPPGACGAPGPGLCSPEVPAPDGTSCAAGTGTCNAGACLDNCTGVNCSDGNDCTADICDNTTLPGNCSNPAEPGGTTCDAGGGNVGACDGAGACVFVPSVVINAASTPITVGCSNNVTGDVSILTFTMDVGPMSGSVTQPFTAPLGGVGSFTESFLDAAQAVVPGGVKTAQLFDLAAQVAVRSGATGADVVLGADFSVLAEQCSLTGATCSGAPGQGTCTVIPSVTNVCEGGYATIPVINGSPNSPGGCTQAPTGTPVPDCNCSACSALDAVGCRAGDPDVPCLKGDQCTLNGFCVNGDLPVALLPAVGNYTAGSSGSTMLFGWYDGLAPPVAPALLSLPPAVFANPTPPIGLRVSAGGLFVALQCLQAEDSGGANGIATCATGPNAGLPCNAPSDNSNNACDSGTDAGLACSQTSVTACTFGVPATIGCINADCGSAGGIAHECGPTDLASSSPDAVLSGFLLP
jgi:hypothetical protein